MFFVNNQLVFFPNGQRIIDDFIIQARDILGVVIINNKITISDMSAVQIVALLLERDEVFEKFKNNNKMIYSRQHFVIKDMRTVDAKFLPLISYSMSLSMNL